MVFAQTYQGSNRLDKDTNSRTDELAIANEDKEKGADELAIANTELAFQNQEKDKRADELAIANKEVDLARQEADRTKSDFISIVSHELRIPLTSIKVALGLIQGGVFDSSPEKLKPIIEIAYKNTERLHHLINEILDVEKLEAGQMSFEIKSMDLSVMLEESLVANADYGMEYSVTFSSSGLNEPRFINGDHYRLIQVMANLLSNAAKFSHPGGSIKVTLGRHNGSLRVSVEDFGSGIPETAHKTLFDKFTQVDSKAQRQKSSSGLGLSIARMIVEAHDGDIDFTSEVGKGTTFFFDLPELTVHPA